MTPTEAIQILDNVTAQVPLTRADQTTVIQALQVLREATAPQPELSQSPSVIEDRIQRALLKRAKADARIPFRDCIDCGLAKDIADAVLDNSEPEPEAE